MLVQKGLDVDAAHCRHNLPPLSQPHAGNPALHVDENGLLVALQIDVEGVDDLRPARTALRDQCLAPSVGLNEIKYGVGRIRSFLVGEIHPGVEPDIDATRHDPEIDVRSHRAMTAAADDRARLDGLEAVKATLEIGTRPTPAPEIAVDRLVLPVRGLVVAAGGIGLPNF